MANTYTLIEAKTVSSAVSYVEFTSIPQTYTDIKLVASARNSGGNTELSVTFNGDTGSNYPFARVYGDGSGTNSTKTTLSRVTNNMFAQSAYTANTFGNGDFYIPNYTSSNYKSVSIDGVTENNSTGSFAMLSASLWSNASAITSIKIFDDDGGNIVTNSTFYLYGIKNS